MKALVLTATPENILKAVNTLKSGDVVAIPTETVYGLAGDAFNPTALTKIFETKERPTFDPLIAHVKWPINLQGLSDAGLVDLSQISQLRQGQIEKLIARFWPGPLTLVLPKQKKVPDIMTSGLASVAVRSPSHPVAQMILKEMNSPLAAPSANRFGRISPTSSNDVMTEIGDRISIIVEGGRCEVGLESTILHCTEGGFTLLRPGKISAEEIEGVVGLSISRNLHTEDGKAASAPGMLASHYAPRTRLKLFSFSNFEDLNSLKKNFMGGAGLLLFSKSGRDLSQLNLDHFKLVHELSSSWSLEEAAQNLFSELRTLDEQLDPEKDLIFCEEPPPESQGIGLGYAIMDRLKRASHI